MSSSGATAVVVAPAAAAPALRLPSTFPRIKGCERIGTAFLTCFTAQAVKQDTGDADAGTRGLHACVRELVAYEACMKQQEAKNVSAKRYRVQEEYRMREVNGSKP